MAIPKQRLPYQRPTTLASFTYKIKPPTKGAYYVTISNDVHNDEQRPVEILINTKDVEGIQWANFATRMMSAVLQKPGEFPFFIVEELKSQFDVDGGYMITKGQVGFPGKVNSLLAHIGLVLEAHIKKTTKLYSKKK